MTSHQPRWITWMVWVSLLMWFTLWLARWPIFPLVLDPYYHLLIAKEMLAAGGIISADVWQHAPVGRVHLYPPVFHLLLSGLLTCGVSPITAIRLLTALMAPAVLVTVYLTVRRLFTRSLATACLLILMVPFSWVLQISGGLASGLAIIELLWFMVAVVEGRKVAGACLLALLFYTHLGLSWVAVAAAGWAVVFKSTNHPREVLKGLGWGLVLASPRLWLLLTHADQLHVSSRYENRMLEIMLPIYLMSVLGMWRAMKQPGRPRVLVALWLGFCLMAYPFTFRWLSGEGLVPICLLAGYGLEGIAGWLAESRKQPRAFWMLLVVLNSGLFLSPTWRVSIEEAFARFQWPDSTPVHLLEVAGVRRKEMDVSLYLPPVARVAERLEKMSQPGEIIWSNATYTGGLLAVFSNRAISMAMFPEVPARSLFDPVGAAQWIVWFRIDPPPGIPGLQDIVRRYQLTFVAQDDMVLIFRNPKASALASHPQAVVPLGAAVVLLCGLLGIGLWDLRRTSSYRISDGKA